MPHVVIIGGGITGLAAAYELQQQQAAGRTDLHYTLVERESRLGGKIVTERLGDGGEFVVEGGPDSFLTQKPGAIALARDLGLGDRLIPTNPLPTPTSILVDGRPIDFPPGMFLIVPTRPRAFARSTLLSPRGRLRLALDLFIPASRGIGDESVSAFVERRLGRETLERLAEPLLSGVHSADPSRQSILATFPRLRAIEREHGSLIRGARAALRATGRRPRAAPFMTLRGGLGELVDALSGCLPGARVQTGATAIRQGARSFAVDLASGAALQADAVILATPSSDAATLLVDLAPDLAARLRAIRAVSTAIVTFAYGPNTVHQSLPGYGLLVPRGERRAINAVTITSRKFADRSPESQILLRVFLGGSRRPDLPARDDGSLLEIARTDLRLLLGIDAAPIFSRVHRWLDAQPQYDVGHLERLETIEQLKPPGLYLAGASYRGVGIPDCIEQGRQAARRAVAAL